ncbi:hypothetical protein JXJ21_11470 [candidate division KSB1 bacterium]|nr:hypothetical protein [candidate division KSB1 bacterium]
MGISFVRISFNAIHLIIYPNIPVLHQNASLGVLSITLLCEGPSSRGIRQFTTVQPSDGYWFKSIRELALIGLDLIFAVGCPRLPEN